MRQPIQLGGATFATKAAVRAHFKAVKQAAPRNTWLTDPFLCAVYQQHPEIGFEVVAVAFVPHRTSGFADCGAIVRGELGEQYEFPSASYAWTSASYEARVHRLLRRTIRADVAEYRATMLDADAPCDCCGTARDRRPIIARPLPASSGIGCARWV